MSDVYLTVDRTPDGALQVSITADGVGYRICGPKYAGSSENLVRHKITARDVDELRFYCRKAER